MTESAFTHDYILIENVQPDGSKGDPSVAFVDSALEIREAEQFLHDNGIDSAVVFRGCWPHDAVKTGLTVIARDNTVTYEVRDDQGDVTEIQALDDSDAEVKAVEFVSEGDYGDSTKKTIWIDVSCRVKPESDTEDDGLDWFYITVAIDPKEPQCADVDGDSDHAWVDGQARGSGGGVKGTDWCARCGLRRHWDTWAQRMDTGEQGLSSIEYEDQDEFDGDTITDRLDSLDVGDLDQTIIGKGDGWSVFLAEAPSPLPWYAIVEQTEDNSPEGYEVSVEWTLSIEDAKTSALELCESNREYYIVLRPGDVVMCDHPNRRVRVWDVAKDAHGCVDSFDPPVHDRHAPPNLYRVVALPSSFCVQTNHTYSELCDAGRIVPAGCK
jgi:hypothetical protein